MSFSQELFSMKAAIRDGLIDRDISQTMDKTPHKPTLWNVVLALLAPDITTTEQRDQINQLVFSFLQNELTLAKLYSQLAQVVGYGLLRSVVRSIMLSSTASASKTPGAAAVRASGGSQSSASLAYIEYGDGVAAGRFLRALSATHPKHSGEQQQKCRVKTVSEPARSLRLGAADALDGDSLHQHGGWASRVSTTDRGFPIPSYFFRNNFELEAFFVDGGARASASFLKEVSKRHRWPLWIDLPESDVSSSILSPHQITSLNRLSLCELDITVWTTVEFGFISGDCWKNGVTLRRFRRPECSWETML